MTIRDILTNIRERLQKAGIEDFEYESWVLLEWKLHIDRAEFYMNPNGEVKQELLEELEEVLKELVLKGYSYEILFLDADTNILVKRLQYLMGECEFMGFDFSVDERVLIPRQDTECLVELAVEDIRNVKTQNRCEFNNAADQKNEQEVKVLDLCTGSGCIGISVKKLCQNTKVTLADISEGALAVAKKNAENLNANVTLIRGNLFENIEGRFDYILSNPPYIPSQVIQGLMPEVKDHEPRLALDGEEDGLAFYRKIIEQAPDYLNSNGRIYFEIGAEQGEDMIRLMTDRGFSEVKVHKDLAGLDRIATGIYSRR